MSESTSPFNEDRPETGSWAAQLFAANAASEAGSSGFDADMHVPVVAREVEPVKLPLAFLAGAGAALIGGLVWAGVVIATQFDIGFLAWFVGAATGLAVVRVAGSPIGAAGQVLAGAFAAGGLIVGKYVIFVHNFGSIVRPVYALWGALAFFAAVRTSGGSQAFTRRHR